MLLLLDVIEKSHTRLSHKWLLSPKGQKLQFSRLRHSLGKALVPSARSAQRIPSQKIMTPTSAKYVHRAARHLQVPFPTAAAFATSEFWTIEADSGLFVQLGSLFSATACFQISPQPCWLCQSLHDQRFDSILHSVVNINKISTRSRAGNDEPVQRPDEDLNLISFYDRI